MGRIQLQYAKFDEDRFIKSLGRIQRGLQASTNPYLAEGIY